MCAQLYLFMENFLEFNISDNRSGRRPGCFPQLRDRGVRFKEALAEASNFSARYIYWLMERGIDTVSPVWVHRLTWKYPARCMRCAPIPASVPQFRAEPRPAVPDTQQRRLARSETQFTKKAIKTKKGKSDPVQEV